MMATPPRPRDMKLNTSTTASGKTKKMTSQAMVGSARNTPFFRIRRKCSVKIIGFPRIANLL